MAEEEARAKSARARATSRWNSRSVPARREQIAYKERTGRRVVRIRGQARRRIGGGSGREARKARGTSKNDRNDGRGKRGRDRGELKRISATIATAADFQTMRRASGAIAFREANSSRRLDISRQEKEEKIRRGIWRRIKTIKRAKFFLD